MMKHLFRSPSNMRSFIWSWMLPAITRQKIENHASWNNLELFSSNDKCPKWKSFDWKHRTTVSLYHVTPNIKILFLLVRCYLQHPERYLQKLHDCRGGRTILTLMRMIPERNRFIAKPNTVALSSIIRSKSPLRYAAASRMCMKKPKHHLYQLQ